MTELTEAQPIADTPACPRHPNRPTAVRCQRCLEPTCVECMVPAPVGFHCESCVATARKSQRQPFLAAEGTTPYITYALIAVNVAVALAGLATSAWAQGELGPIGIRGGLLGGGVQLTGDGLEFLGVDAGEWYRIFTGAFIHAGPIHLGFNMLILWQAGTVLEPVLGRFRFALLYTAAVLGGSFGALLLTPDTITIGASGGVFGLMGALFVIERSGLLGFARSGVGFLILINLVITFAVPRISIGGHLGGLLAGLAVGWAFQEFQRRQLNPTMPVVATVALMLTLFAGCIWAASRWTNPIL